MTAKEFLKSKGISEIKRLDETLTGEFIVTPELMYEYLSQRNGEANQLSEVGKVRIFNITFRGKDERGEIIKGIDVVAESSEQAMDLIRQVSASNEIYSTRNKCEQNVGSQERGLGGVQKETN